MPNPFQDIQSHYEWQFQIEQDKARLRKLRALGEFAGAPQIVDSLLAIVGDLEPTGRARPVQRALKEKHIVFVVFNQEDCGGGHRLAFR